MSRVGSLNLEHVSPSLLNGTEISRRSASAATEEATTMARMRRWFFSRKPDAGFVLTDFPATLLQAKVFDEWLETRNEGLNVVFAAPDAPEALLEYYRSLGLLAEVGNLA